MMSAIREPQLHPNADSSRPARPFNWVQWAGAALVVCGILAMLSVVAARLGLIAGTKDMLTTGTSLCVVGTVLINSRREPVELSAQGRRRRLIIIAVALAVCAVVAGAVIYFQGA